MIVVGKWRWPLTVGVPLIVGGAMVLGGLTRLHYEGTFLLGFSGPQVEMDRDLKMFQSGVIQKRVNLTLNNPAATITYDRVPGHKTQIFIRGEGYWPKLVVRVLHNAAHACVEQSLNRRKLEIHKEVEALQPLRKEAEERLLAASNLRNAYLASHLSPVAHHNAAKIQELQNRRQFLIEHYPTHTDIPLLAKKIRDLQSVPRSETIPAKLVDLDRALNEALIALDYRAKCANEAIQEEKNIQPAWTVVHPAEMPPWPIVIQNFTLLAGVMAGLLILGCVLLRGDIKLRKGSAGDGLWKPVDPAKPVELTVVPVEPVEEPSQEVSVKESALPSDPLTQKASELYAKWVEVSKVLYMPAPEAPQGVIESVGPLLQESIEFLPEGHDVLARYLADTVAPGDLPAHVARTVLMTLAGAQDAGVSEEHRLAMALAALFHDLAVVPRPAGIQDEVGSDVGRLSASVLRRIPGMEPMMLAMVEDILIGMDEFKLETWQNVANGKSLEPLSKVLREIDRFEKMMQKQKQRLGRQVVERKAS